MIIKMIEGFTNILGKSQGYLGLPVRHELNRLFKDLPVRDELVDCTVEGPGVACMVTAWEPTPEELDKINRGAPILVRIMGSMHPPIMLLAGDVPGDG